jgi:peptide/nickel transport system ATP-binding protein
MTGAALLEASNLSVAYRQGAGWARAVDDVTFTLQPGEVFGLVGESGCGKSTVSLQLLGYRHVSMRVDGGAVRFKGQDLTAMPRTELDRLRGDRIAFVPQNPTTALNPGIRIGAQLAETMLAHSRTQGAGRAASIIADTLKLVGLPAGETFQRRYPHQLSGGQQQRVCIAMALACDPDLLVLDEPTTALDPAGVVLVRTLLRNAAARGTAVLVSSHHLDEMARIADHISVMHRGRIVGTLDPAGVDLERTFFDQVLAVDEADNESGA